MPRENSFSDSEGRSLTPDIEAEDPALVHSPTSPTYSPIAPSHRPPLHGLSRITSKQTLNSKATSIKGLQSPTVRTTRWENLTPKEKFRSTVRKVIAMHRGLSMLTETGGNRLRVGAEPGVDPRHLSAEATYGHTLYPCRIEVVDYSAVRNIHRVMSNDEFVELMDTGSDEPPPKPPWAKVRWINIAGLSWDVIKAVSIKYDLHPLALEDVFHGHARNRSKADYYTNHLFLRVLCHQLVDSHDDDDDEGTYTTQPRTTSPEPILEPASQQEEEPSRNGHVNQLSQRHHSSSLSKGSINGHTPRPLLPFNRADTYTTKNPIVPPSNLTQLLEKGKAVQAAQEKHREEEVSLDVLKQGDRVNVKVFPVFIFLLRDGTVVSLQPSYNSDLTLPISQRLRSRDTVLTKSADPSLLVHALLDLLVDKALQVIDQYHAHITKFERDVLLKSNIATVRKLHILSGDLILHKRTLEPIKTLVYGLRRYDVDRCAALIDNCDPNNKDIQVVGFMSHNSKIYLADVFDHMEYILSSIDMFAGTTENLITYSFNLASYEMNEVMRRLTLATIISLPMTILTGYFGMNFNPFWAVNNNTDLFFWKVAIPILVFVTPLALLGDLKKLWKYLQHRGQSKRAIQSYKRG
ncbi:magnesium transporter [Phlegmacium glaucopus]|nr:magnesium transporter [Phlegmacium glaucopus]